MNTGARKGKIVKVKSKQTYKTNKSNSTEQNDEAPFNDLVELDEEVESLKRNSENTNSSSED